MIKQGLQDMILVGGAQETNYYSMSSFDALGTFSSRMKEPTKASRPFDKDRDGLIPSEELQHWCLKIMTTPLPEVQRFLLK